MPPMTLLTDFDGPVTDVSGRYYQVYCFCLQKIQQKYADSAITILSKREFWDLKRANTPETEIGIRSGLNLIQAQEFSQCRRASAHTFPYFEWDRLWPGVPETLTELQRLGINPYLITMRRVTELAFALEQFGLTELFPPTHRYCLGDDFVKTQDHLDKPVLMAQALAEIAPAGAVWMVGDTEADIIAAQTHGIPVVAVLSGIRDEATLSTYKPDFIQPDLATAVQFILDKHDQEPAHK